MMRFLILLSLALLTVLLLFGWSLLVLGIVYDDESQLY